MQMVQIAGRLGSDPETRFTPGGQKVTSFRMATNSRRAGKEETTWWRVTIWGDRFDKMLPFLKKGSAVIVYGEVRAAIYTDKAGQPQIGLEVTADTIKFSPFGGGEKSNTTEGSSEYSAREHTGSGSSSSSESSSSNGRSSYSAPGYIPVGAPALGKAPSHEAEELDEDLPF